LNSPSHAEGSDLGRGSWLPREGLWACPVLVPRVRVLTGAAPTRGRTWHGPGGCRR
jgi:hypothetical protein